MIREAIDYVLNLGREEDPIIELEEGTFSKASLIRVEKEIIEPLKVSTLTSVIEFIKNNIDEYDGELLIQVESPSSVRLLTPLMDRTRDLILISKAIVPDITYDRFMGTEEFNILLQSSFVKNEDRNLLLKFTGLIQEENIRETGDDGISQKATIKTGITTVSEAEVPNPVRLAPYRTFQEIEQVESQFVFRMKSGPEAALFEADGGAWKNETMRKIHDYLEEHLVDEKVKIIS